MKSKDINVEMLVAHLGENLGIALFIGGLVLGGGIVAAIFLLIRWIN